MLLRREVFEHKQAKRLGEALIATPLAFKVLAVFVALIVVAISCLLYWGTYTNKQTVAGYIFPSHGLVTVRSPIQGVIVARYVSLDDHVQEGQRLYRIALQRSTLTNKNVNATLLQQYDTQLQSISHQTELYRQLWASEADQLEKQQHDLGIELKNLDRQLQTLRSILALSQKNLTRYQKLAGTGMVSKTTLQRFQREMLVQQAGVERIEKTRIELRSQLGQIPQELFQAKANMEAKISALASQAAQVKQQRLRLQVAQAVVVRAPTDGIVSSVIMRLGQNVTDQSPLVSILPHGSVFQVRLLVPTRAIGFVHVGQPVRLRYSAFPYQQFGLYRGWVRAVSRSIILPGELDLPVNLQQPYYLVTASLAKQYVHAYGRRMPLTAGMTLSADIVLYRERLYEWVLRPIESLRGRL